MKRKHVMVAPPASRGRLLAPEYDKDGKVTEPEYQVGDVISKGGGRFKLVAMGNGLGGGSEVRWTAMDCATGTAQRERPTSNELAVFGYRIIENAKPVTPLTREDLRWGDDGKYEGVTRVVGVFGTVYDIVKVRRVCVDGPNGRPVRVSRYTLEIASGEDDEQLGGEEHKRKELMARCYRQLRVRVN